MEIKKAFPWTKAFREVKKLYFLSFEPEERLPFFRMAALALLRSSVDLLAYYEGEIFCGFSFTVCTEHYLYINFFAVSPELRSKGYGTKILNVLRQRYPIPAVCDAKAVEQGSAEFDQDVRRIRFWERNGFDFFDDEYTITNSSGIKYIICSTKAPFSRSNYWEVFDYLSFGPQAQLRIYKQRLKKK